MTSRHKAGRPEWRYAQTAGMVPIGMVDTTSSLDSLSALRQAGASRTPAEIQVRRILRIPERAPSATRAQAERLFSISIFLSALRCLVTYVAVPVLGPIIGSSVSNSPAVGIPLGVLALVFDVRSVRRFWMADHPWRWRMTWVYVVVAAMVTSLLGLDIARLFSR